MIPKPSTSGMTLASVTSARSFRPNATEFAKTQPVSKCVTGLTLDLDQHITILNLHWIHRNLRAGNLPLSGLWIPRPAVPRADDSAALDYSLAERASAVQTGVF